MQCDTCLHQDIVIDDFIVHMEEKHNRRISTSDAAKHLVQDQQPFTRLCYCSKCGIRHCSNIMIRMHFAREHAENSSTPTATTTVTATSTAPVLQQAPGVMTTASAATATATQVSSAAGAVAGAPVQPRVEQLGTAARSYAAATSGDRSQRNIDYGEGAMMQRQEPKPQRPMVSKEVTCMLADEQYCANACEPSTDLFPYAAIVGMLHGIASTTRWDEPRRRQRIIVDTLLHPGFYDARETSRDFIIEFEVTVHNQHPRRYMTSIVATERNPEGRSMSAVMMTTSYPATVVSELYFDDAPAGLYDVNRCGSDAVIGRLETYYLDD